LYHQNLPEKGECGEESAIHLGNRSGVDCLCFWTFNFLVYLIHKEGAVSEILSSPFFIEIAIDTR